MTSASSEGPSAKNIRASAWLSKGFEVLAAELDAAAAKHEGGSRPLDFEVVVIGSGYGGAVAAAKLAASIPERDAPRGVCVLERGREYLRGMFPTRLAELPRHIRYSTTDPKPRGERTALLDFRAGPDMTALVANGLGGGSLINAGVMARPRPDVFDAAAWPPALRNGALNPWLDQASELLGASKNGSPNVWTDESLLKVAALNTLTSSVSKVALTVAVERKESAAGVQLEACVRCGDCATGCNYGAKESLDTNLLAQAQLSGAALYTGATVLRLEKVTIAGEAAWAVVVNHTDEKLRRRQKNFLRIYARRIVLAAGTLGSTEILLRSRRYGLPLSPRLGKRFTGNGDMLASLVDLEQEANAVADETVAPNRRHVGPTITRMIDERKPLRSHDLGEAETDSGLVIQDLTVPNALMHLFQEASAVARGFDDLSIGDGDRQSGDEPDPCAIDEDSTKRALIVAIIGHDSGDGTIELTGECPKPCEPGETGPAPENEDEWHGDGAVQIHWPRASSDPRLDERQGRLAQLQRDSKLGGRTLPNPLWRVLPAELEFLFGEQRGSLLTVHPLGGCAMGEDAERGVVDHLGRVYDTREPKALNALHAGLVVLDGSIVPSSLGINPALTIAALALRAIDGLMRDSWAALGAPAGLPRHAGVVRPHFRDISSADAPAPNASPTKIEVLERMSGLVRVRGHAEPLHAELTLQFESIELSTLLRGLASERRLVVNPKRSRLRLFTREEWEDVERRPDDEPPDEQAAWIAPIESGTFTLFRQEPSRACVRRVRALGPWLFNRGARDIAQELQDSLAPVWARLKARFSDSPPLPPAEDPPGGKPRLRGLRKLVATARSAGTRIRSVWSLLSLAGEVRLLEYELHLGQPTKRCGPLEQLAPPQGHTLTSTKKLTYDRKANPWNQLLAAKFESDVFKAVGGGSAELTLDLRFLERRATPLFRLLQQADQVTALVDVVRFALYFSRILLRIHTWSFRKPDVGPPIPVDRFPRLDGVEAETFDVDTTGEDLRALRARRELTGKSVVPSAAIRLTRFPPERDVPGRPPVLMIHGYSVSGTTFAHPAAPSLARHLSRRGFDAWIVDLRTSAALETAKLPWSFEEVAYADIPKAVDFIVQKTGFQQIDIVAHCMGSAMVCMALLEADDPPVYRDKLRIRDPFRELRIALKGRVRRLVLSQVAPITLFTPNNVFRAFVLRYLRYYLNLDDFAFRVEGTPTMMDQLLDRFLATLPYPKDEFVRENPPPWRLLKRTPWTSTRHRMDALYGRDFSIKNVSDETLKYIDDFFGPLNVETVSQAIHFSRYRTLTDKTGFSRYVTLDRLREQLSDIPVLSLHGEENGLVDEKTANYVEDLWSDAGFAERSPRIHWVEKVPRHGHQDCFIGMDAETEVFPRISAFLEREAF